MTGFLIPFCTMLLINANAAADFRGKAFLNGVAELRCGFEGFQKLPNDKVNYYWQRGQEVVNYMDPKDSDKTTISERYQNRSILEQNGVLKLYNVKTEDQGDYTCHRIVQREYRHREGGCTFHLEVFANFSDPEIRRINGSSLERADDTVEVENGTTVSFQCTSGQGFPKPEGMNWNISGSDKPQQLTEIKNINETFYISTNLSLWVTDDINITCVLQAHHTAVSQTLHIVVKNKMSDPPVSKWNHVIIFISCFVIISFSVLLAILKIRKRKQRRMRIDGNRRDQEARLSGTEGTNADPPEALGLMTSDEAANGS